MPHRTQTAIAKRDLSGAPESHHQCAGSIIYKAGREPSSTGVVIRRFLRLWDEGGIDKNNPTNQDTHERFTNWLDIETQRGRK